MPITIKADLVELDQGRFSKVAYEVMSKAFAVHQDLGSLFDESVYRNALADRLNDVLTEVQIDVRYRDFCKVYFMDALVAGGALFELKAVKELNTRHRTQLLNYLLLANLNHGKLINFGTAKVEHEFVNATLTHEDRKSFAVEDRGWIATDGFGANEKELFLEILRDWGGRIGWHALQRGHITFFLRSRQGSAWAGCLSPWQLHWTTGHPEMRRFNGHSSDHISGWSKGISAGIDPPDAGHKAKVLAMD